MIWSGIKIQFNKTDMGIPRRFYAKMRTFPVSIWDRPSDLIEQFLRKRVDYIKSHTVSQSTIDWRRRAAKANIRVRTHTNTRASVRVGSQLGVRTGTLLSDIAEVREPGMTRAITDFYRIKNSRLLYKINPRKFYHRYPIHFQNHLI